MATKLKRKLSATVTNVKRRLNLREARHEVELFDENLVDKHLNSSDPQDVIFRELLLSLEEVIPYKGSKEPTQQNFNNVINQKLIKLKEMIPNGFPWDNTTTNSIRKDQKKLINWYCSIANTYKADWEETRNETEFIGAPSFSRCCDNNLRYTGAFSPDKMQMDDTSGKCLRVILPNILGDYTLKSDKKYARNFVFSVMNTSAEDFFSGKLKFDKGFGKKVLADLQQFAKDSEILKKFSKYFYDNDRKIVEDDNMSVQFSDSDLSDDEIADRDACRAQKGYGLSDPNDSIDEDLKHFLLTHTKFRNQHGKVVCKWIFNVLVHDTYSKKRFLEEVDEGANFYDFPKLAAQLYFPNAHYMGTLDKKLREVMDKAYKTHKKGAHVVGNTRCLNFSAIKMFPISTSESSPSSSKK